ncbi:IgA FC receptor [Trichinella patagoniensis]|uniref:IgA FC receptor n=1 Tax=Trichinella patagoniensis TaxID=990121 RepID=A0A0V1A7V5_9BILA|nr:IgA FC receptor [Trichinella patagoniensis]
MCLCSFLPKEGRGISNKALLYYCAYLWFVTVVNKGITGNEYVNYGIDPFTGYKIDPSVGYFGLDPYTASRQHKVVPQKPAVTLQKCECFLLLRTIPRRQKKYCKSHSDCPSQYLCKPVCKKCFICVAAYPTAARCSRHLQCPKADVCRNGRCWTSKNIQICSNTKCSFDARIPICPIGPDFPSFPFGPGNPVEPGGPGSPRAPSLPSFPGFPFTPGSPGFPGTPGCPFLPRIVLLSMPDGPFIPTLPFGPGVPGGPISPGFPGDPFRPCIPGFPGLPDKP